MSVSKTILLAAVAGLLSVSCASTASNWQPQPFKAGQTRLALGTNAFTQMTHEVGDVGTNAGEEFDENVLSLNASYGYFYQPNVEFGGSLGYNDADSNDAQTTTWILGGYLRYWIDTRASIRPFIQGRIGLGNADYTNVSGMIDGNDDLFEYGVGAGLASFLSQNTSVDVLLEYSDRQFDNSNVQTSGIGLSAFFSVYF